jgi:hypothetical protein
LKEHQTAFKKNSELSKVAEYLLEENYTFGLRKNKMAKL